MPSGKRPTSENSSFRVSSYALFADADPFASFYFPNEHPLSFPLAVLTIPWPSLCSPKGILQECLPSFMSYLSPSSSLLTTAPSMTPLPPIPPSSPAVLELPSLLYLHSNGVHRRCTPSDCFKHSQHHQRCREG